AGCERAIIVAVDEHVLGVDFRIAAEVELDVADEVHVLLIVGQLAAVAGGVLDRARYRRRGLLCGGRVREDDRPERCQQATTSLRQRGGGPPATLAPGSALRAPSRSRRSAGREGVHGSVRLDADQDWTSASFELASKRITSPSRKIDPATTIRGAARHAAASASPSDGSAVTGSDGAIARACAASASGSAERGFEARVNTASPTAGSSARSMAPASLSRIAANTSGGRAHADFR